MKAWFCLRAIGIICDELLKEIKEDSELKIAWKAIEKRIVKARSFPGTKKRIEKMHPSGLGVEDAAVEDENKDDDESDFSDSK